jgi:hypothetical protein
MPPSHHRVRAPDPSPRELTGGPDHLAQRALSVPPVMMITNTKKAPW